MRPIAFLKRLSKSFGPGFITGAADDDPSGIATYSQTGAMFGYSQLWTMLFAFPFMTVMQEMCGRIGLVTGKGLSRVIKEEFSLPILWGAVLLLSLANIINIGANLGAMAAAMGLIVPVPFFILLCGVTIFILFIEVIVPYPTFARFLKYLTLSLFAYVITAFLIKQDWGMVLTSTITPHITFSKDYIMNIAAILGTTISPYLFFWQADQEVEEAIEAGKLQEMGEGSPRIGQSDISSMRIDTVVGMFFSQLVAFFIMLSVAGTFGMHGGGEIATASDAAAALRPVAGDFAFLIFTIGIIGTGLLSVPVLAGAAGYAISEAIGWKVGLNRHFMKAKGFYVVIILATLVGVFVNMASIPPMTMLYYAAILNGVLAPPLMILILIVANKTSILGTRVNSTLSNTLGILITVLMSIVSCVFLYNVFIA